MELKLILDCEDSNRYYLAAPDGFRFIFENGQYVGCYNSCLECVI